MGAAWWLLAAVALFLTLLALALVAGRRTVTGGGRARAIVVDTLNLMHWLGLDDPLAAVDATAASLRARYESVTYVTKSRTSAATEIDPVPFQAAAARNGVTIAVAMQYADPPRHTAVKGHTEKGRDDYYMAFLASRLRCPVATNDRLRDLPLMKGAVPPFHVWEFAPWKDRAARVFIKPEGLSVRRPRLIPFERLALPPAAFAK